MNRPSNLEVGERIIALLDEAQFTATYKYAVLLALIDLCLKKSGKSGPDGLPLTTTELAREVLAIYWPQVRPSPLLGGSVLRQSNPGPRGARIVTQIERFKTSIGTDAFATVSEVTARHPTGYLRLLKEVERVLIEMPLPRLQVVGRSLEEFLYRIPWGVNVDRSLVQRYLRTGTGFDNRVLVLPGIPEALVQLNGLLRPLIQRSWALKVARLNNLRDVQLHDFLFGQERVPLLRLAHPLAELQNGRCFLCGRGLTAGIEVDHFIPWSRTPNDNIENLVAVHQRCNARKRDFLPAVPHVNRWAGRLHPERGQLEPLRRIANRFYWGIEPEATLGVARAIYGRLPASAKLWVAEQEFVERGTEPITF
jgi:5-methylcytosine-specific restriction endonuclease McrA